MTDDDDDHFEPQPGLPEPLPAGERLLWQGAPDWRRFAVDVVHLRAVAGYFAALLLLAALFTFDDTGSVQAAALAVARPLPVALLALGLLAGFAWLSARTTLYTVTDRRVVMRVGIVLTVTYNLPFTAIATASVRQRDDDTGDIALVIAPDQGRIAWAHLWPHARPWRLRHPEPSLRAITDVARVAGLLADALRQSPAGTVRTSRAPVGAEPSRVRAAHA